MYLYSLLLQPIQQKIKIQCSRKFNIMFRSLIMCMPSLSLLIISIGFFLFSEVKEGLKKPSREREVGWKVRHQNQVDTIARWGENCLDQQNNISRSWRYMANFHGFVWFTGRNQQCVTCIEYKWQGLAAVRGVWHCLVLNRANSPTDTLQAAMANHDIQLVHNDEFGERTWNFKLDFLVLCP